MWLLCVVGIFVLISSEHVANGNAEFFQSDETTFQCEHNVALAELSQVEWKIDTKPCVTMQLDSGDISSISYKCGLLSRANMTATNLTIFSLESYDDGEFSCTAVKSDFVTEAKGARFNVTVKVRPNNHRLLYNDTSYDCNDEVIVDSTLDDLILKCSVDSKPQATFTWSINPPLSESLLNNTECDQGSDLVFNCSNVLTLPSEKIQQSGVEVTCHVQAFGNTTDLCIKLAPLTTTQLMTTTVEDTSTASPSTTTAVTTGSVTTSHTTSRSSPTTSSSPTTTTAASAATTKSGSTITDKTVSSTSPLTTDTLTVTTGSVTTTSHTTSRSSPPTSSSPTTTTTASAATTKSGSTITDKTVSSTSPLTTDTLRLATYKANVRFPNKSYDPNMADRNSSVFNKTDVEFCGAVDDDFKSLVKCFIITIRPGSVLIDASLQFNQDALKEELTDQLQVTSSIGDAIKQKMQRSKAPLFQDAEISISADDTTKSSTTTPINPPPASKWKNIYILPIIIGVAIIIIVVVLICRSKNHCSTSHGSKQASKLTSRSSKQARNLNSHRPPYAVQTSAYPMYDTIPDTIPARPHMTSQQPYANNDGRHQHMVVQGQLSKNSQQAMRRSEPERNEVQGQSNKNGHEAMRSEPADQNANYRRPGQMLKKGHEAARKSKPAKFKNRQSHPHVGHQLQHSSAASAGYRAYRGYTAYGRPPTRDYPAYPTTRVYPAYGGHPPIHSQMPVMSYGTRPARAYNSYTVAPKY